MMAVEESWSHDDARCQCEEAVPCTHISLSSYSATELFNCRIRVKS
jgi:hypothetical protein